MGPSAQASPALSQPPNSSINWSEMGLGNWCFSVALQRILLCTRVKDHHFAVFLASSFGGMTTYVRSLWVQIPRLPGSVLAFPSPLLMHVPKGVAWFIPYDFSWNHLSKMNAYDLYEQNHIEIYRANHESTPEHTETPSLLILIWMDFF